MTILERLKSRDCPNPRRANHVPKFIGCDSKSYAGTTLKRKDLPVSGVWTGYSLGREADYIRAFYRDNPPMAKLPCPDTDGLAFTVWPNGGLGDCVVATALPRASTDQGRYVHVTGISAHLRELLRFNPHYQPYDGRDYISMLDLECNYDCGGGHFIQRMERSFKLKPEIKPRGCIIVPGVRKVPGRCAIHVEPHHEHVNGQRIAMHGRARIVYPENMAILDRLPRLMTAMDFWEIGNAPHLREVGNACGLKLADTIRFLASCEYFIGIDSGPGHLAAALGCRMIQIVNFPYAHEIILPALNAADILGILWLYPQACVLHEDGAGPIVPRFTERNLIRAIEGDVYPYWRDDWLSMLTN